MLYILGANLPLTSKLRFCLSRIHGIGRVKAYRICDQLGLSNTITVSQLTRFQVDQMIQLITQSHLIDAELKRLVYQDIRRLLQIGAYRGLRHRAGLPLRGQRTHTNAKTSRKFRRTSTS